MRGAEQARGLGAALLLGLFAGCGSGAEAAAGLLFAELRQDLGVMTSGEQREVRFAFEVQGAPVVIHRFEASCGCIELELLGEGGQRLDFGQQIPEGTRGELRALWDTSGFLGVRKSQLRLLGEGPGLPATLHFQGELEPWFEIEPAVVRFETAGSEQELSAEVVVRGPEPFRLLDILAGLAGVRVEGLPSAEPALEQRLRLVREAGMAEEGRRAGFVQLRTDQEYAATIPIEFTVESLVYTRPALKYLLREVVDGRVEVDPLELGAREGELELRDAQVEGVAGAAVKVETLEEGRRYALRLVLPPDLASGPVRGTIHLLLAHRNAGRESLLQREIQFFGLATSSTNSESQER